MPLYVEERGGEEWQIGLVVGVFGMVGMLVRPFAGQWVARWGAKAILILGILIFLAANLSYIFALTIAALVLVRLFHGAGSAMSPVATITMVANLAPERRRAEGVAFHGISVGTALMYAPLLGFWVMNRFGFTASFGLAAFFAFIAFVVTLLISSRQTMPKGFEAGGGKPPLINARALFPGVAFLSFTLVYGPLSTFLPLLTESRDLGNPGLYYTINSLFSILVRTVSGPLADRVGRAPVIIPGLAGAAVAMFMLAAATNLGMFLGSALILGTAFGLLQPALISLTIDRVTPSERSSALATFQLAWDFGGAGGALTMGFLAGLVTIPGTFTVAGLITLLGLGGFMIGNARSPTPLPGKREPAPPKG